MENYRSAPRTHFRVSMIFFSRPYGTIHVYTQTQDCVLG
jgi:hypothetical protein